MTVTEYQEYVRSGASSAYNRELAMLGLVGEVGELADVIKKENIYPNMDKFIAKYGMSVEDKIKDEAGDVLWQLMLVLCKYNLSFEDVMHSNVEKLNARHGGAGKIAADGGNR